MEGEKTSHENHSWDDSNAPSLLGHLSLLKEQDCLKGGEDLGKNEHPNSQATTHVPEKRPGTAAEMHQLQQQIHRQGHDITALTQRLEHATVTMKQQLEAQEVLQSEVITEGRRCQEKKATVEHTEKQNAELTQRLNELQQFQEKLESEFASKAEQRDAHQLVAATEVRERAAWAEEDLKQRLYAESKVIDLLHAESEVQSTELSHMWAQHRLHEEAQDAKIQAEVFSATERRLLEAELSAVQEATSERRRAEQLGARIEAVEAMRRADLAKAREVAIFQNELAEGFLNLQQQMQQQLISSGEESREDAEAKMRFERLEEQRAAQLSASQDTINLLRVELRSAKEAESSIAQQMDTQTREIIQRKYDVESLRVELQQAQKDAQKAQNLQTQLYEYIANQKNNRGCLRWGKEPPIPGYTKIN